MIDEVCFRVEVSPDRKTWLQIKSCDAGTYHQALRATTDLSKYLKADYFRIVNVALGTTVHTLYGGAGWYEKRDIDITLAPAAQAPQGT